MSRQSERQARRNDRKPFKLPDRNAYLKEHCLGLSDKDDKAAPSKHYISPPKVNNFTKCYNSYNADDIDPLSRETDKYYDDEDVDNFIVYGSDDDLDSHQSSGKKNKHRKRKHSRSKSENSPKKLKVKSPRKLILSSSSEDEGVQDAPEKSDVEDEPLNISASAQERRKKFSEILASSSSDSENEKLTRSQSFRINEESIDNQIQIVVSDDQGGSSSQKFQSKESTACSESGSENSDEEFEDEEETMVLESERGILLSRPEPEDQKRSTRHDRVVQKQLNTPAHSALEKLLTKRMIKKQKSLTSTSSNNDDELMSDDEEVSDVKVENKDKAVCKESDEGMSSTAPTLYSSFDRLPKMTAMRSRQNVHYC